jgi:benzoate membrane transport protein
MGSLKTALAGNSVATKAAVVTFVIAASGVSFVGIGSALWSLTAGLSILALHRLFDRSQT